MAAGHDARRASAASQSPPHRHITEKSPYASTGFFLCNTGPGDEKPRPGFDHWRSQGDGMTEGHDARRASAASQSPPHRHIYEKSPYASTGSFLCNTGPGDEKPRPGFDHWRSQGDGMAEGHDARRASAASQSPPHRHITEKSPYASTGFFLCNTGPGDEKPRPDYAFCATIFSLPDRYPPAPRQFRYCHFKYVVTTKRLLP